MKTGLQMALAALLVLAAVAAGCGGNSTGEAVTGEDPLAGYLEGPTRQFFVPGGDNTVQEYGREATAEERQQVTVMVRAWLGARADHEWAKACSYFHESIADYAIRAGSAVSQKQLESCARGAAALAAGDPLVDNMKGAVASLRIAEGHGYAQYHGRGGHDWVVPVRRDKQGNWKVSSLDPKERLH